MKTKLIRAALFTPGPKDTWGLPLLLWGEPGVAKTAILRQIAAEYGMPIEVLSPACRGEGAFGVTPVPADGRMTYPRPDWTDKFEVARCGIVFVDEINLAATHYAGALLGLLSDRVLGSHCLGPHVRIMAAANPISIAAASGGWDLSAPAANRVGHLEWPCPDVSTWTKWLLEQVDESPANVDATTEESHVLDAWPQAWADARGVIAGFLSSRSTQLHVMPKSGGEALSKAWPSPRTWEYAARAFASAGIHDLTAAEREELVGAFVGGGAAGELFGWYEKANLPNSIDLLDGQVSWKHKVSRLDISMAVFSSAVATCAGTVDEALRKKRAEMMWSILAQASDDAPDIVVGPAQMMIKEKMFSSSIKVTAKLKNILVAVDFKQASTSAATA